MECCIFAFALGGRGIQPTGMGTRTLIVFNFWLVIAVGICAAAFMDRAGRSMQVAALVMLGGLGITLVTGHLLRLAEWAAAWRLETKILADAPVDDLRKTPPNATILYVNRLSVYGAPIFAAPWDLNAAMPWKYPFLTGRIFLVYDSGEGTLTWGGRKLAYQGRASFQTPTDLYVWIPMEARFFRAGGSFRILRNFALVATSQLGPG